MQNRQLQTWLSDDEYEQIAAEWDTQKNFREELKDKPDELKKLIRVVNWLLRKQNALTS